MAKKKSVSSMKFDSIHELFSRADRWVKGSLAYTVADPEGSLAVSCKVTSPKAVCFCLLGGVKRVYAPGDRTPVQRRLRDVIKRLFPDRAYRGDIIDFNDHSDTDIKDIRKVVKLAYA